MIFVIMQMLFMVTEGQRQKVVIFVIIWYNLYRTSEFNKLIN